MDEVDMFACMEDSICKIVSVRVCKLPGVVKYSMLDIVITQSTWEDSYALARVSQRGQEPPEFSKHMINSLLFKKVSSDDQKQIINAVDKIIEMKNKDKEADINGYENYINQYIYRYYGLTEKEIEEIEKSINA
jgi:hypothetical protein